MKKKHHLNIQDAKTFVENAVFFSLKEMVVKSY